MGRPYYLHRRKEKPAHKQSISKRHCYEMALGICKNKGFTDIIKILEY